MTDESRLLLHPTSIPEAHLPVPTLLREMNPRTAYLIEMPGNHGDKLSYYGAKEILNGLSLRRTFKPQRADVILMMGQATITDVWKSGVPALEYLLNTYSTTPIVVLPSSFSFTTTDFESIFRNRTERCVLYARDTMSWNVLDAMKFPNAIETYCDHDLAFFLHNSTLLTRLRRTAESSTEEYSLIVERQDREHHVNGRPDHVSRHPKMPGPMSLAFKSCFWAPKQSLQRLLRPERRLAALSPEFKEECNRIIAEHAPDARDLPWVIGDLSSSGQYSFSEFCSRIAQASVVVTTRLHVGILAAMLGKPTFLRAGNYGKIPGVYAMSMYDWPNVKLFGEGGQIEH